jgi:DNA-directed RNA polymerase specialized sigma24 family protein
MPTFHSHLLECLDPQPEVAGVKYLRLYNRLLRSFEWGGCHDPEWGSDETLDRVNSKLEQGTIDCSNIYAYMVGVARNVNKECLRRWPPFVPLPPDIPDVNINEYDDRLECLNRCLQKLPSEDRVLILRYYEDKDRAGLANMLNITVNALRLRACRIRDKLEHCVLSCLQVTRRE